MFFFFKKKERNIIKRKEEVVCETLGQIRFKEIGHELKSGVMHVIPLVILAWINTMSQVVCHSIQQHRASTMVTTINTLYSWNCTQGLPAHHHHLIH